MQEIGVKRYKLSYFYKKKEYKPEVSREILAGLYLFGCQWLYEEEKKIQAKSLATEINTCYYVLTEKDTS